jgi:hypothetical protein
MNENENEKRTRTGTRRELEEVAISYGKRRGC